MIFSNTVTLGLQYDTSQEKLTLTLVEAKVLPISIKYNPGESEEEIDMLSKRMVQTKDKISVLLQCRITVR